MSLEKIYWDSNCFLGHFQAEAGKAEKCDGVIQRAERGDVLIVTSALTLAEVLWSGVDQGYRRTKPNWSRSFFVDCTSAFTT
jgi:predicted nucleic acid-binding protein